MVQAKSPPLSLHHLLMLLLLLLLTPLPAPPHLPSVCAVRAAEREARDAEDRAERKRMQREKVRLREDILSDASVAAVLPASWLKQCASASACEWLLCCSVVCLLRILTGELRSGSLFILRARADSWCGALSFEPLTHPRRVPLYQSSLLAECAEPQGCRAGSRACEARRATELQGDNGGGKDDV